MGFRPSIPFRHQARDNELRSRGERLQQERERVVLLMDEVALEQRLLEEEREESERLRRGIEEGKKKGI